MKKLLRLILSGPVGQFLMWLLELRMTVRITTRFGTITEGVIGNHKQFISMMEESMASRPLHVTDVSFKGSKAKVILNGILELDGFTLDSDGRVQFPKGSSVKRKYVRKEIKDAILKAAKSAEI